MRKLHDAGGRNADLGKIGVLKMEMTCKGALSIGLTFLLNLIVFPPWLLHPNSIYL